MDRLSLLFCGFDHAHHALYYYFALIFVDSSLSAKIGPLESFQCTVVIKLCWCKCGHLRGVGRWLNKGGLYRSIGQGKGDIINNAYRKHRGALAPGAPMVPTPMHLLYYFA